MRSMMTAAIGLAVLGGVAAATMPAGAATLYEITEIQKATPSCKAHPQAQWVGRVSGSVEDDMTDDIIPVSFVGCFDTQAVCETWKEKTSGFITGPIVQYSCRQR